jgi:hypothetical protein
MSAKTDTASALSFMRLKAVSSLGGQNASEPRRNNAAGARHVGFLRDIAHAVAPFSGAAIYVLVGFPQSRLLHLAHRIARKRLHEDDVFGHLEFRQAVAER